MTRETKLANLRTDNPQVLSTVAALTDAIKQSLVDRLSGIFAMGSLARGGFSEVASDIDVGVILNKTLSSDSKLFAGLIAAAQPSISNRISIFWGDSAALCGENDVGRYPPFDRLDLLEHAVLIHGIDTRSEAMRPSFDDLLHASATFALEYLATSEQIRDFKDSRRITDQGVVGITKTILFPARFIYLAATGKVAGNDVAADYYQSSFEGPDTELVGKGFGWRSAPLPPEEAVTDSLEEGLIPLYQRFIDIYVPLLIQKNQTELADRMTDWRDQLSTQGD